jgi:UDP-2-acetamido-3-amino-2,3-dideoxy-glucuronate N-acetyltransferase
MNDIRVGVVGAGYWGPNLMRVCEELGVLAAVCDADPARLRAAHAAHPQAAAYDSYPELLTTPVDAVVIASPARLHAAMALDALAAGKHVFVEKPLALTVEDGQTVADRARALGLTAFVGHVLLYHPGVRKLRDLIAEGAIGRVWHLRSRRLSLGKLRTHENVWWSFAPHDVALMLAIMESEPVAAVSTQASLRDPDVCDVAYADYDFGDGRSAHVEVGWLDPEKTARLDVFGERGVLTLTDSRTGSSLRLRTFTVSQTPNGAPTVSRGEEKEFANAGAEPLREEMEAFLESVHTGRPAPTSAENGVRVLKALAMAQESAVKVARSGVPV